MKYIVTILAILMVSGYGVSRLMDTGMRQVEQAGNIKRNAEKRLEVIREITEGLVKETAAETEVPAAAESDQVRQPEHRAEVFHVRMDDSVSLVILRLGHPDSQEPVGDIQILRYRSCNITCQHDHVIGWSIR